MVLSAQEIINVALAMTPRKADIEAVQEMLQIIIGNILAQHIIPEPEQVYALPVLWDTKI
jgi:hypothetical protein